MNKWVPEQASCEVPEENYEQEITVDWDLGDTLQFIHEDAAVDA